MKTIIGKLSADKYARATSKKVVTNELTHTRAGWSKPLQSVARLGQVSHLIRVASPVDPEPFVVSKFEGKEGVSTTYSFTAHLLSPDAHIELKKLVGFPMTLMLDQGTQDRYFHGYVSGFERVGTDGGLTAYRAVIEPWLAFLRHTSNCRIFQDRSVPEIVDEIFQSYGQIARYRWAFDCASASKLPYCVQYNQSDFDFVSMLLEREGIFYAFEHEADSHELILSNDSTRAAAIGPVEHVQFQTDQGLRDILGLDHWSARRSVAGNVHVLKSFDFKQPRNALITDFTPQIPLGLLPALENYRYDGAASFVDSRAGDALSRIRAEAATWRTKLFDGSGTSRALHAGSYFVLDDHFDHLERDDASREFFIVELSHTGENHFDTDHADAGEMTYRAEVVALRRKVPFRAPSATPRVRMPGPQTATVVGPPGEELFADRYGRVKVQFHWDRLGQFDQASSCWIRVASPWAGSGMGGVSPPRVGQEVVVDFLDGDPDRPIIVGRVFNEDNMPPFGMEVSGLKSKTVKGEGSNELTMHDSAGSELMNLHAQRDMASTIQNDHNGSVGNNQSMSVGSDNSLSVGGNHTLSVTGDSSSTVSGSETSTVTGSHTQTVTGAHTQTVTGAVTQTYEAGHTRTVTSGGSNETITGDSTSTINGAFASTRVGAWSEMVSGTSKRTITDASTETHEAGRTINVVGADAHNVEGNVKHTATEKREISANTMSHSAEDTMEMSGGNSVAVNSSKLVRLGVGAMQISISDGEITISGKGSTISVNEAGVSINGKILRLNC